MEYVSFNNIKYELKFGINSLRLLTFFSNDIDEENIKNIFFLSIENVGLPQKEKEKIYNFSLSYYGEQKLIKKLKEAIKESRKGFEPFDETIYEELFKIGVGELGLSPDQVLRMTPKEIQLAYEGYIDKQQLFANCMLIAIRQAKDKEATKISLLGGKGYDTSSIAQREKTFKALGVDIERS